MSNRIEVSNDELQVILHALRLYGREEYPLLGYGDESEGAAALYRLHERLTLQWVNNIEKE